jgi:hypothetical protein
MTKPMGFPWSREMSRYVRIRIIEMTPNSGAGIVA